MSLVVFEDVSLHLGGKRIVEGLGLRIAEKDRIGLIGPNGSGKTTMLRMLAGETAPDGGSIRSAKNLRLGYLPQDVGVDGGRTLLRLVLDSVPGKADLEAQLTEAEAELERLNADPDHPEYIERVTEVGGRVGELHERLAAFEAAYSEHQALAILAGLGFRDGDSTRDVGELSGGWKMRAVLASLLFQRPDLLLLDEPTNHLDMPSVAWLSEFLKTYDRAFVLISHDREFLNEQINKIVSYEPEGVRQYPGDYVQYKRQRAEELELLRNRQKNLQREREEAERFIRKFRAKATKAPQVQSRIKKLEKMEIIELPDEQATINFRFPPAERAGKTVLEVEGLRKAYGDQEVLRGVDLRVQRGERIALLGVNGAGKTTLLRTLAGEIEATGGSYQFGHKTKVGYYAQHHADTLDRTLDVYTSVKRATEDATHQQVRAALGAMLFGDQEIEKSVGVLSGGERARVALAQLLVEPGNVLLMDEPTNHLDLESSERLADALGTFDGTLLFVSHNKAFIRALAQTLWFVEDGKVVVYPGTFDDYLEARRVEGGEVSAAAGGEAKGKARPDGREARPKKKAAPAPKKDAKAEAEARRRRQKKLKPLERRSGELEKTIERLEREQEERTTKLSDPSNGDATALSEAFARAQAELEVAMESWSEVQEELERLRAT